MVTDQDIVTPQDENDENDIGKSFSEALILASICCHIVG